jgi:hypothetical protein
MNRAHYTLIPEDFAALERSLSVACKSEKWLPDGGIFWNRKSFFAANPHAFVGLGDCGIEVIPSEPIAIASPAAHKLLSTLRSKNVRYIDCIEVETGCQDEFTVYFKIIYDKNSEFKDGVIVSKYTNSWIPEFDINRRYSFFRYHKNYREYERDVESVLQGFRYYEDTHLPLVTLIPIRSTRKVSIDVGLFKAFLAPARSEDTTMLIGYCGPTLPILARAGDIIAIINTTIED